MSQDPPWTGSIGTLTGSKEEMMTDPGRGPAKSPPYSATDARQGEIILRTRRRRIIFIVGLVGIVVLALLGSILGYR